MENYRHLQILVLAIITLLLSAVYGQETEFTGTFKAHNAAFTLRFKPMTDSFHGTLQTSNGVFPLKGEVHQQEMKGIVYTEIGNYDFSATSGKNKLIVLFQGVTYQYLRLSQDHELDNVDLTPYFKDTPNNKMGNLELYAQQIAGSQLVYYQRTSLFNDSMASSMTYVNFCKDGRFGVNYEGSFSVEGDYGGNAHGANYGSNFGTWKVIPGQNGPALQLNFANGGEGIYPINPQQLYTGRWRIGNTQYALQKGKVICR
ncbi:hypothetical protein U6A24_13325 [Aquimarina gracilis]|uniref:Uncharacterized protein n=1 Tax=Aquimarina gracilis TaxID=874422 RepID=A0ABU5ZX64_9FLAO|nr:hypothetical protein [Aquimarina gracilis]MEB3346452.1 hypothetical protein [Aquimarina gracilis]